MKKIILFFAMSMFVLTSCVTSTTDSGTNNPQEQYRKLDDDSFFVEIPTSPRNHYIIVYDKKTRVMYTISNGLYNRGTFTVLVDANGKPKLYNE